MKRIISLLLITMVLAACDQSTGEDPPAPTQIAGLGMEESAPVDPTVTPDEPTESAAEPDPAEYQPTLFADPFEDGLQDGWQFTPDDSARYSLEAAPGFLQLAASPEHAVPTQVLYRAPVDNFQITTMVLFLPSSNFQFAGLTIFASDEQRMNFGRAFSQCEDPARCQGNAIYFDLVEGVFGSTPNFGTPVESLERAYLRLHREGNRYSGYYSPDGENWQLIGEHTSEMVPALVGLVAGQAFEEALTAEFDFFTLEAMPILE